MHAKSRIYTTALFEDIHIGMLVRTQQQKHRERERRERNHCGNLVQWLKYEDKQAVFHYSQRWHCSGCRTEATRSVGSRTQRDL